MKVLLTAINAKYIHSNPAVYSLKSYAETYLEAGEKEALQLELAEYTINHTTTQILADIYKKKPGIVAFSCYIWNWSVVEELLTELPKVCPNVPIWLGGPEVSFHPEEILKKYPKLTGIMIGEGEETFLELCRFYLKGGNEKLTGLPGVVTREGRGPERELMDLDRLPFFYDNLDNFTNRIVYYESSRGCPYRCSYCLSSIDKKVRLRSLELVKKELQFFLDHRVPQVKFIDRTFNCNHEHAMFIWQYILENDNGITNFHFEISADILSEEELELLSKMRPGLVQLEIGVQSTNEATIREIRRVMNVEKLRRIVARIQAGNNIHEHLDLIAGLPYEDYESFRKSFNEVYSMKPEQLQLGFLKVLKGSYMEEKAADYGIAYTDRPPYEVLSTNWISYEEILRLKQIEEMVELYYNSSQFRFCMGMLEKSFETPFALYEALADFYERKGYRLVSPARSYRYHVLLEFCREADGAKEEMYRELLTFDAYLRENMKTRLDFAPELESYKDTIREIYKKEEQERRLLPEYREYNSKQLSKMTHLEVFSYTVWEQGSCTKLTSPRFVIFDYNKRSPLTMEAEILQVSV